MKRIFFKGVAIVSLFTLVTAISTSCNTDSTVDPVDPVEKTIAVTDVPGYIDELSTTEPVTITATGTAADATSYSDSTLGLISKAMKKKSGINFSLDLSQVLGITEIDDMTFLQCKNLISISLPETVTTIGRFSFNMCKGLTSFTIPTSVTNIGYGAFNYCSSLTEITIPANVTSIGTSAFYGCTQLKSIAVDSSNTSYCSEGNVLFNKDKTILLACPIAKTAAYTVPSTVTTIGERAFALCSNITSIVLSDSLTTIEGFAFEGCSGIIAFTIPSEVSKINYDVFYGCSSLSSVTFEDSSSTWTATDVYSKTYEVTVDDVSNNVENLTLNYKDCIWTKQ